jgi:N-acetyl-anhydromuramoyl-L-alanine amidase
MRIHNHWLTEIEHIISPNYNARPDENDISLLVIHCISLPPGQFGGDDISRLFCNQLNPQAHPYFQEIYQLEVSAHLLIRRDGRIIQYVPFNQRAWHAGASCYQGREKCNDFSIGIELEGCETVAYEKVQYQQLARVIQLLLAAYPNLCRKHITGHSDIAPQRKTDPGASFDWNELWRCYTALPPLSIN